MKQILIALLLAFTTSTVINAQKQSSIEKDSTENVKVTLSKKTDTKADESNTTVTVIGVDTTDMDTTAGKGDNDLPFGNLSDTISGGILISIIAIVATTRKMWRKRCWTRMESLCRRRLVPQGNLDMAKATTSRRQRPVAPLPTSRTPLPASQVSRQERRDRRKAISVSPRLSVLVPNSYNIGNERTWLDRL
mgnify:CR=1 FL=1